MKPAGLFRDPTSAESQCQHLQLDKLCSFSEPENPCVNGDKIAANAAFLGVTIRESQELVALQM